MPRPGTGPRAASWRFWRAELHGSTDRFLSQGVVIEVATEASTQLLFERKAGRGSHILALERKVATPTVVVAAAEKAITEPVARAVGNAAVQVVVVVGIPLQVPMVLLEVTSHHNQDMAVVRTAPLIFQDKSISALAAAAAAPTIVTPLQEVMEELEGVSFSCRHVTATSVAPHLRTAHLVKRVPQVDELVVVVAVRAVPSSCVARKSH